MNHIIKHDKTLQNVRFSFLAQNCMGDAVVKSVRGRPLEADGAKTRQKIIAGARECFAVNGYANATNKLIAESAGVTASNIYNYFPKEYDAQIADCILELFRKRDAIDVFNKKALYIYIREMIDVKTPKITKIANKLHKVFKEKYLVYYEKGFFPS